MATGALMYGLAGAVSGGADKYSQIKDEQRKFNMDQMKQDAQFKRQQNLARFQKQIGGSGMYNEQGKEYSEEQYGALDSQGQAGAVSKFDMQTKDKLSQWVEEATGLRLTEGQVAERGGNMDGLVTTAKYNEKVQTKKEDRAQDRATEKATTKAKETKRKEAEKLKKEAAKMYDSQYNDMLDKYNPSGGETTPAMVTAAKVESYKRLKNSPAYAEQAQALLEGDKGLQEAIDADTVAMDALAALQSGTSPGKIEEMLKSDYSLSSKEVGGVWRYLETKGLVQKGWIGGYKPTQE